MNQIPPRARPPTPEDVKEVAARHHMELTDREAQLFSEHIAETVGRLSELDNISEPNRKLIYSDRQPGYRPCDDEDPYNVFITRCEVSGATNGPLSGYDIGLKDHISLAGVEMTCASKVLKGYVPKQDATIVSRLLDAGCRIVGKLNMEEMSASGAGENSGMGPVRNPYNPDYLAGGSSSGAAAAVANGDVDIAIGGDQGGSIRNPAATCGCVGLKPTFGLVPHTGAVSLAPTMDYLGPITRTVEDCAKALDVIAGKDGLDPRQSGISNPGPEEYEQSLSADPSEINIGFLTESTDWENVNPDVVETVRAALDEFESVGASVEDVSIPWHSDSTAVWSGILSGEAAAMVESEGMGRFSKGHYDTQFGQFFSKARRAQADDFSPTFKLMVLSGQYVSEAYGSHYYAKAQNLRHELSQAYDDALADVDVLATPTLPNTAAAYRREATLSEVIDRGLGGYENRAPFNVTGHPAISVPCGTVDGLPVGLQLIGDMFDDAMVLRAAEAFEQNINWEDF